MKANANNSNYLINTVTMQFTIIHDGNCDKMINNQAHKLCA